MALQALLRPAAHKLCDFGDLLKKSDAGMQNQSFVGFRPILSILIDFEILEADIKNRRD